MLFKISLNENNIFGEWAKLYLEKKKREVNETHYTNLCSIMKHTDFIKDMPLSQIKPYHIDYLLSSHAFNFHTGSVLSKKTLKNIRNIISNVYQFAIEADILVRNPAIGRPISNGVASKKRRALNNLEKRLINQYTDHYMYIAVMIMLHTGMRRGELIALKWSKVLFDEHKIIVDASVYSEHGKFYLKNGTKTDAGIRVIPITNFLKSILITAKQQSREEYVCHRKNGKMHTENSWIAAWNSYITYLNCCYYNEKTGENRSVYHPEGINKIIKFTAHMLRHTYATTLYLADVKIKTAQNWLGHASASTTMDLYTHIEKSMIDKGALDSLNNYIKNHYSV